MSAPQLLIFSWNKLLKLILWAKMSFSIVRIIGNIDRFEKINVKCMSWSFVVTSQCSCRHVSFISTYISKIIRRWAQTWNSVQKRVNNDCTNACLEVVKHLLLNDVIKHHVKVDNTTNNNDNRRYHLFALLLNRKKLAFIVSVASFHSNWKQ